MRYFSDALWPEFSTMDFLKAVLYYQMYRKPTRNSDSEIGDFAEDFLKKSKDQKRYYLLKYCFKMKFLPTDDLSTMYSFDKETLYRYFKLKYNLIE